MNRFEHRYAFRLDPETETALQQIADRTFRSKASIMRRYVQDGVKRELRDSGDVIDECRLRVT